MQQVRAVRPRVFTINLPRGVKFEDLAEALVAKRPPSDFERVTHFGFGRYEIKTSSDNVALELAKDPTLRIKDSDYQLNYLGNNTTRVSVFYYPVDENVAHLEYSFRQFGKVKRIEEAKYKNTTVGAAEFTKFLSKCTPLSPITLRLHRAHAHGWSNVNIWE